MIENTTENRQYTKPNIANFLQDDVVNLENALDQIDEDVNLLLTTKVDLENFETRMVEVNSTLSTKASQANLEASITLQTGDLNKLKELRCAQLYQTQLEHFIDLYL